MVFPWQCNVVKNYTLEKHVHAVALYSCLYWSTKREIIALQLIKRTHIYTHTHEHTRTHTHIHTHTHTYTRTHTNTHKYTHIHTNTHMNTLYMQQKSIQVFTSNTNVGNKIIYIPHQVTQKIDIMSHILINSLIYPV